MTSVATNDERTSNYVGTERECAGTRCIVQWWLITRRSVIRACVSWLFNEGLPVVSPEDYLQWHTEGGGGGVQPTHPPEIPKALQNRAKLNPICENC